MISGAYIFLYCSEKLFLLPIAKYDYISEPNSSGDICFYI